MAYKAHTAVGLSKPLWLPDDIVFETKIIPADRNYVRSSAKRDASVVTKVTRHETANFNAGADAEMHYRWLMSNVGNNPDNAAGYNCVSDDRKIIHMTPYDEVTWAAGTKIGNLTGDHHELCANEGIDHGKARRIAAALDAAVAYARGLPVSAVIQHNAWTGKHCPKLLREQGLWPWYVQQVTAFYEGIRAQVEGAAKPPASAYQPPSPIPGLIELAKAFAPWPGVELVFRDQVVRAIRDTPRYRDQTEARVGPDIKQGEEFRVIAEQAGRYITPYFTRVNVADTEIVEPKPAA